MTIWSSFFYYLEAPGIEPRSADCLGKTRRSWCANQELSQELAPRKTADYTLSIPRAPAKLRPAMCWFLLGYGLREIESRSASGAGVDRGSKIKIAHIPIYRESTVAERIRRIFHVPLLKLWDLSHVTDHFVAELHKRLDIIILL